MEHYIELSAEQLEEEECQCKAEGESIFLDFIVLQGLLLQEA